MQWAIYWSPDPLRSPDPYVRVQLLPSEDDEPHYHARSTVDGHQRALTEGQC